MKRSVTIFGLILGLILSINVVIQVRLFYTNPDMHRNAVLGYTFMVLVFSLIFFGIRNYRNKELGGVISFGRGFKTGTLIALVASTMYVIVGLSYYYLFAPDFMDLYTAYVLKNTPAADLPAKTAEMANFKEMYKNPLFAILISYSEVFPIGLVVALISALILKKKNKTVHA